MATGGGRRAVPALLEFSLDHLGVGDLVWVSDEKEAFVAGRVHEVTQDAVVVRRERGGLLRVPREAPKSAAAARTRDAGRVRVLPRSPPEADGATVENMDVLTHLHEASILDNVGRRFAKDLCYTATGPILLAVNPFKWLPIYGPEVVAQYHAPSTDPSTAAPHCFAVAEAALREVKESGACASVIICGESGAGKTETTKLMLSYLSRVATPGGSDGVAARIMGSNPVMEAFGNAKTLRNNNSSRFGKFVRVCFGGERVPPRVPGEMGGFREPRIFGATITNYLLEKSRVVAQGKGERGYHIFYQLLAGASHDERRMWHLRDGCRPSDFAYLAESGCERVDGYDDADEWNSMRRAMDALGFPAEAVQAMLHTVAACLHLGNVRFDDGASPGEGGAGGGGGGASVAPAAAGALEAAADLLSLASAADLGEALTTRVMRTPDGSVKRRLDTAAAVNARDAVSKSLYGRMFDALIAFVNEGLAAAPSTAAGTAGAAADAESSGRGVLAARVRELYSLPFIGILDIYGFENMAQNGFEQLFINYANEKLQNLFNTTVFEAEERVYREEGIEVQRIDFPDNQPCLDLIEKRSLPGILPLIDSECLLGARGSDASLAANMVKTYARHPHFEAAGPSSRWRGSDRSFVIQHFAGPILYQCADFVDKNRDTLYSSLEDVLASSRNPFIARLFHGAAGNDGAAAAAAAAPTASVTLSAEVTTPRTPAGGLQQTVAQRFREDMAALHSTVSATILRFVRCIKPTALQRPGVFDAPAVLEQLTYAGVLAALEMRRAGFPTRVRHALFLLRYLPLLSLPMRRRLASFRTSPSHYDALDRSEVAREVTGRILDHPEARALGVDSSVHCRVGISQVFLRANVLPALDAALRRVKELAAARMQGLARGRADRRRVAAARASIVALQARQRGALTRRIFGLRVEARTASRSVAAMRAKSRDVGALFAASMARAEQGSVRDRRHVHLAIQKAQAARDHLVVALQGAADRLVLPLLDSADVDGSPTAIVRAERVAREGLDAQRLALQLADLALKTAEGEGRALREAVDRALRERELERTAEERARRTVEEARTAFLADCADNTVGDEDPMNLKLALGVLRQPGSASSSGSTSILEALSALAASTERVAALTAGGEEPTQDADLPFAELSAAALAATPRGDRGGGELGEDEGSGEEEEEEEDNDDEMEELLVQLGRRKEIGPEERQAADAEAREAAGDGDADGVVDAVVSRIPTIATLPKIPTIVTAQGLREGALAVKDALDAVLRATGGARDATTQDGDWRRLDDLAAGAVQLCGTLRKLVEAARTYAACVVDTRKEVEKAVLAAEQALSGCKGAADMDAPGPGRVRDDPDVLRAEALADAALESARRALREAQLDSASSAARRMRSWRQAHARAERARTAALAILDAAKMERRRRVAAERARRKAADAVTRVAARLTALASRFLTLSSLPPYDPLVPAPESPTSSGDDRLVELDDVPSLLQTAVQASAPGALAITEAAALLVVTREKLRGESAFFLGGGGGGGDGSPPSGRGLASRQRRLTVAQMRRVSLVYRPRARAAAFEAEERMATAAVERAEAQVEIAKTQWKQDAKRRSAAVRRADAALSTLADLTHRAVAAGVSSMREVTQTLKKLADVGHKARAACVGAKDVRELAFAERLAREATESAEEALHATEDILRKAEEARMEQDVARQELRPILERYARLEALLDVGPVRVWRDDRVSAALRDARSSTERAAQIVFSAPEDVGAALREDESDGDGDGGRRQQRLWGVRDWIAAATAAVDRAEKTAAVVRAEEEKRVADLDTSVEVISTAATRLEQAELMLERLSLSDVGVVTALRKAASEARSAVSDSLNWVAALRAAALRDEEEDSAEGAVASARSRAASTASPSLLQALTFAAGRRGSVGAGGSGKSGGGGPLAAGESALERCRAVAAKVDTVVRRVEGAEQRAAEEARAREAAAEAARATSLRASVAKEAWEAQQAQQRAEASSALNAARSKLARVCADRDALGIRPGDCAPLDRALTAATNAIDRAILLCTVTVEQTSGPRGAGAGSSAPPPDASLAQAAVSGAAARVDAAEAVMAQIMAASVAFEKASALRSRMEATVVDAKTRMRQLARTIRTTLHDLLAADREANRGILQQRTTYLRISSRDNTWLPSRLATAVTAATATAARLPSFPPTEGAMTDSIASATPFFHRTRTDPVPPSDALPYPTYVPRSKRFVFAKGFDDDGQDEELEGTRRRRTGTGGEERSMGGEAEEEAKRGEGEKEGGWWWMGEGEEAEAEADKVRGLLPSVVWSAMESVSGAVDKAVAAVEAHRMTADRALRLAMEERAAFGPAEAVAAGASSSTIGSPTGSKAVGTNAALESAVFRATQALGSAERVVVTECSRVRRERLQLQDVRAHRILLTEAWAIHAAMERTIVDVLRRLDGDAARSADPTDRPPPQTAPRLDQVRREASSARRMLEHSHAILERAASSPSPLSATAAKSPPTSPQSQLPSPTSEPRAADEEVIGAVEAAMEAVDRAEALYRSESARQRLVQAASGARSKFVAEIVEATRDPAVVGGLPAPHLSSGTSIFQRIQRVPPPPSSVRRTLHSMGGASRTTVDAATRSFLLRSGPAPTPGGDPAHADAPHSAAPWMTIPISLSNLEIIAECLAVGSSDNASSLAFSRLAATPRIPSTPARPPFQQPTESSTASSPWAELVAEAHAAKSKWMSARSPRTPAPPPLHPSTPAAAPVAGADGLSTKKPSPPPPTAAFSPAAGRTAMHSTDAPAQPAAPSHLHPTPSAPPLRLFPVPTPRRRHERRRPPPLDSVRTSSSTPSASAPLSSRTRRHHPVQGARAPEAEDVRGVRFDASALGGVIPQLLPPSQHPRFSSRRPPTPAVPANVAAEAAQRREALHARAPTPAAAFAATTPPVQPPSEPSPRPVRSGASSSTPLQAAAEAARRARG